MKRRYRKKLEAVIEAVQWSGENYLEVHQFIGSYPHEIYPKDGIVKIHTLEGVMIASPGDYIIRVVSGEYYPCKPDIFDKIYEPVDN